MVYLDTELMLALPPVHQPQTLDGGGSAVGEPLAVDRAVGAPPHHIGFTEPVRLVLELPAGHH